MGILSDPDLDKEPLTYPDKGDVDEGIQDPGTDTDEDDDDDAPLAADGAVPVDPPEMTRKQKRANRYSEMKRRAEESERQMQQMREQLSAIQATQAAQVMQSRQGATAQRDPEDVEMDRLKSERKAIWNEIQLSGEKLSSDRARELEERVESIADQERSLSVRREVRKLGLKPHNPQEQRSMELRIRHPEVFSSPKAARVAAGYMDVEIGSGRVDINDPASLRAAEDRAAAKAKETLGLGKSSTPPSDARRAKYAGPQASGTNASATASKRVIKKTADLVRMSNAMFDHIEDPDERWKQFATTVGRDMADNGEL